MSHYGSIEYWEERYSKDPEPFDWLQRYQSVREVVSKYVQHTDRILNVGAGNSRMSEEMYDDGYKTIVNIDFSPVCVSQMKEKYKGREGLTCRYILYRYDHGCYRNGVPAW